MPLVPDYLHSFPSEQRYFDSSKQTKTALSVFDPAKTAADYGVEDLPYTKEASSSENGGGEGGEEPSTP